MANFIDKIGLDRVAHFGVGGTLYAGFMLAFALANINFPTEKITLWNILLFPFVGYIIVAFAELIKEVFIDNKIDWIDVIATFAGCVFIHICTIIGYLFSRVPTEGLIRSTAGWIIFGIVILILAGAWIYWVIKSKKK